MNRHFFILFSFCILVLSTVKGQEFFPLHLDEPSGLPTNVIYSLAQDKKGYIWMGSDAGLVQYDGFKYNQYKSVLQSSLPGSNVQIDKLGRVWYQNFDGYVYYADGDSVKGISQNTPIDFIPFGITDQYLFVVQKRGIDVYDIHTLKLKKTIEINIYFPEHANVADGNYYFIADDVIYKLDKKLNLTSTPFFKNKCLKIKYIYPYKNQLYVLSKNNEEKSLYFFDLNLNFEKSISLAHVNYIQGSSIIDDQILIFTSKGVYAYNDYGHLLWNKNGLLSKYSIASVLKDYQQNYWVGTTNNGVFIIPELQNRIYTLDGYLPLRIVSTHDGYWVSTQTGELLQLDDQLKVVKVLTKNDDKLPIYYLYYDSTDQYSVFTAVGFTVIPQNNFEKSYVVNAALKQHVKIDLKYSAYAASGYCMIFKNSTYQGNSPSIWDNYYEKNLAPNLADHAHLVTGVRGKAIDYNINKKEIICATNTGLYSITPATKREILYNGKSFYAAEAVWVDDVLYVLDTKGNLFSIDANDTFTLLNAELDIEPFSIQKMKKIGEEILLIDNISVRIFNPHTGDIQKSQFNFKINSIKDVIRKNGYLLILTNDGILKMMIADRQLKVAPRFWINSLIANNKPLDWTQSLRLSHSQNNLQINFSVLEYAGNIPNTYYRLNSKEWIQINNSTRTLSFPSLSSGAYVLEFKVGNLVTDTKIQFEVLQPFWKAWWFYLLCFAVLGGLVTFYFKRESKLMKNQIQLLNDKVILEKSLSKSVMTSIKSQMNPHFFYNALNTIQAYIFMNDKTRANTYLAKFSKLTRLILEMSEKETIALSEELDSLKIYLDLEKMRFKDSFEYEMIIDKSLDIETIEIPPMIIQPYVENAIKHGLLHRIEEKQLVLFFSLENEILKVVIDDNGIGRTKAEEINKKKESKHQSFASRANEKRLEILNKSLGKKVSLEIIDKYDKEGNALGTKVELFIPIN